MRIKEVKERIGAENVEEFREWMHGKTMGLYSDCERNYYDCDVEAFCCKLKTDKEE